MNGTKQTQPWSQRDNKPGIVWVSEWVHACMQVHFVILRPRHNWTENKGGEVAASAGLEARTFKLGYFSGSLSFTKRGNFDVHEWFTWWRAKRRQQSVWNEGRKRQQPSLSLSTTQRGSGRKWRCEVSCLSATKENISLIVSICATNNWGYCRIMLSTFENHWLMIISDGGFGSWYILLILNLGLKVKATFSKCRSMPRNNLITHRFVAETQCHLKKF